MLIAVYDFEKCPATFDFCVFAASARSIDPDVHFVFVPNHRGEYCRAGKFPEPEWEYRFRHIILECAALYGTYTVCPDRAFARRVIGGKVYPAGYSVDRPVFEYQADSLIRLVRSGRRPVGPKPSEKAAKYVKRWAERFDKPLITVTLRTSRHGQRNSDIDAWAAWMASRKDLSFAVLPDTDTAFGRWPENCFLMGSVNIDLRLAIYSVARQNCFTSNGCTALLIGTDSPFLMFKAGGAGKMPEGYWDKMLIPEGTQPDYCRKNQRFVWADDTVENIEREVGSF